MFPNKFVGAMFRGVVFGVTFFCLVVALEVFLGYGSDVQPSNGVVCCDVFLFISTWGSQWALQSYF